MQHNELPKEGKRINIAIWLAALLIFVNAFVIQFTPSTAISMLLILYGLYVVGKHSRNNLLVGVVFLMPLWMFFCGSLVVTGAISQDSGLPLAYAAVLGAAVFTVKGIGQLPKVAGAYLVFYGIALLLYRGTTSVEMQSILAWIYYILLLTVLYKYVQFLHKGGTAQGKPRVHRTKK